MADLPQYRSTLTGPELDEALRNIGSVEQSVTQAAQYAATAQTYGQIVADNQAAIQAVQDNLSAIQQAPAAAAAAAGSATTAAQYAADAATAARTAASHADDAEDAAQRAEAAAGLDPDDYYTKPQADARFQMPVGYLFEWAPVSGKSVDLSTPEKVAAFFGYGTWAEFAPGKVLAAQNSTHAAGTSTGAETHAITTAEMPAHSHNIHGWSIAQPGGGTTQFCATYPYTSYDNFPGTTKSAGSGKAMSLMQPTQYVYRWQRIA